MLKEKDLQELQPQKQLKGTQGMTLSDFQNKLKACASENEIPIAFAWDQVKYGGLLGSAVDCLVVYHPEHQKDYFSIAVTMRTQGNYCSISTSTFGTSKLMKADAMRKAVLSTAKEGWNNAGTGDLNILNHAASGAAFVGAGIVGLRHLVKGNSDKLKMEEEQQWYSIICDLINEATS